MPQSDATRDHASRAMARWRPSADESQPLEERVYRAIRRGLIRGDFLPGEPLSIRRIARALDTSVMPVRTCLRRLLAEQCLDSDPGGTAVVPQLRRSQFAEIVRLRAVLEPMAAALAASRITAAELAQASALSAKGHERRQAGDERAYQLLNYEFHFSVYRAAASPLLLSIIETLWVRRSPIMRQSLALLHARGSDLHDELMSALGRHNRTRASSVLRNDIEQAGDYLIERLSFPDDAVASSGIATLQPLQGRRQG